MPDLTLTLTDDEVAALRGQALGPKERTEDLILRLLRQQFVKPVERKQRVQRVRGVLEKIADFTPEQMAAVNQAIDDLDVVAAVPVGPAPVTLGIVEQAKVD